MWVWNHNKTRKIQIDRLVEIAIRYNDSEKKYKEKIHTYSVVGVYQRILPNLSNLEILLFTDNEQSICQRYVDNITIGEKNES